MAKPQQAKPHKPVDVAQLMREVRAALDRFTKPSADEVQLQILGIVKDIRRHQAGGGGLSPAEEAALAEKLNQSSDTLQGAVEANQPPTT